MTVVINGTSGITDVNGTAAAPAITGTDTDTGVFFGTNTVSLSTGGTERLQIDSSGNAGLGVTPSAWWSTSTNQAFQTASGSVYSKNGTSFGLGQNVYASTSGGGWKYVNNGYASLFDQDSSQFTWYTAASGTAGASVSWTQAMTLNASGNLAINDTSFSGSWNKAIRINGSNGSSASDGGLEIAGYRTGDGDVGAIAFYNAASSNVRLAQIYGERQGANNSGALTFHTTNAGSGAERARIDSSGRLLVGGTGLVGQIGVTCTDNSINAIAMTHSGATAGVLNVKASDASYTSNVIEAFSTRANNSAFALLKLYTSGGSDTEFNLRGDGNGYADGTWNNNGADYAEYFESTNGLALTVGATVVLEGNKVREATSQDAASAVMGVVRPKEPSKASMVIGNTAWNKWADKYLTDDFDRYIMEDHDVVEWTDEEGRQHSYESHNIPDGIAVPDNAVRSTHDDNGNKFQHYKLNPAWNPDVEYVNRENRAEWNIIGLLGQVKILKGQPVGDRWVKMRDVSDSVEEWMIR